MFKLFRIIIAIVLVVVFTILIRRLNIKRIKLAFLVIVIISLILSSLSGMFPFENLIITYDSPDSVFNYVLEGEIQEILYGSDSCMVIFKENNNTWGHYWILKSNKGYKIPSYFSAKKISHKMDNKGIFDVYNIRNTKDYYIIGLINSHNMSEVSLYNSNGKIKSILYNPENSNAVYFHLNDYTSGCYIMIDGEKVLIGS